MKVLIVKSTVSFHMCAADAGLTWSWPELTWEGAEG